MAIERTQCASKVGIAKQVLWYRKIKKGLEWDFEALEYVSKCLLTYWKYGEYAEYMPTILHIQNYFTDCQTCPSAARQQIGTNFEYEKQVQYLSAISAPIFYLF